MTTRLETHSPIRPAPVARPAALPWLNGALLVGAGIFVFRPVTMTWNNNPNYAFGWWIPFVALFLFAERWSTRPARETKERRIGLVAPLIVGGLVFFIFRVVAESDPDWRPGLWVLAGLYVATLLGWLWIYGGFSWLRHFAFPVCFLFLSLPWFYQIEGPLTQGLMQWNTRVVAGSLQMIAISAQPIGNTIQLQNCQLGVEEACSGILSLQASVMMGCLLGEIYRLAFRRRLVLVLAGVMFALIGNYLRTFFLALMAFYNGPDAVTRWHDTAGFSILAFTAVCLWLAALCLRTGSAPGVAVRTANDRDDHGARPAPIARRLAVSVFMVVLLAEAGTQAWYGWREAGMVHRPEWIARLPKPDTFQPIPISDAVHRTLEFDSAQAGRWRDAQGWNWTAYWFQYKPKPFNRIILGWHTPDHCLPSIGIQKDRDYPNFVASVNGLDFYVHARKFLAEGGSSIYLFWVVYPINGDLFSDEDTRWPSFLHKIHLHLHDVWKGYRGVGVESLEVAVTGPPSYEAAQSSYLAALRALAIPVSPKLAGGVVR